MYNVGMENTIKKTDRRVRKTEAQLKLGLVRLMQKKSIREITVKELVEEVDINRSTFYLHYTDIFHMLESFENELTDEFLVCLNTIFEENKSNKDKAQASLLNLFLLFDKNRELCKALLGPNGDPAFCHKIEKLIGDTVQNHINNVFPSDYDYAGHIHQFSMAGCFGLIKEWIETPKEECKSPEDMAAFAYSLLYTIFKVPFS